MKRFSISTDDRVIDYEIVHRPAVKRRIHLELGENGQLRVVAPRRMSRRAIQSALQQRAHHVARFLVKARSRQQAIPVFNYVDGEQHLFMGQWYPLKIRHQSGRSVSVERSAGALQVLSPCADSASIRGGLVNWYRQQAASLFSDRLAFFTRVAPWTRGVSAPMRLRLMKRTWGSCSSKGVITLNPHLVKAPPRCIDYVIAHEICHLKEHNHGRGFYVLQEQLYPGWREAKAHLRGNGHIYLHG